VTHYSKAPIIEAVVELQVIPKPDVTISDAQRVSEAEASAYPHVENRVSVENTVEMTGVAITNKVEQRQVGFVRKSSDQKQQFHSTIENFVFSRLAPYDKWASFIKEAERLWIGYRQIMVPSAVKRIGIRYINRIVVPNPRIEIKDYLRTFPELSPDLPQELANYFMQVTVPLRDLGTFVTINSTLDPTATDHTILILDIDCFVLTDFELAFPDFDDKMSSTFDALHTSKNSVFEFCITDATRELIL
jgi:uncharacterized protein (TIGR04255 family)